MVLSPLLSKIHHCFIIGLVIWTLAACVHLAIASINPHTSISAEPFIHDNTLDTGTAAQPSARTASTPRNQSLWVVLVNFQDIKIQTPPEEIHQRVFGTHRSVASYFKRNSYGTFQLTPAPDALGLGHPGVISIELNQNHPNPSVDKKGQQQLSQDLIRTLFLTLGQSLRLNRATMMQHNFPPILFVFAGQERTYKKGKPFIAPSIAGFTCCHKKIFFEQSHQAPATRVPYFSVIGERHGDHPATRGIYAHEVGHLLLGLPDLYKTTEQSTGINYQGLMGRGSWNHAAGEHLGASPADMIGFSKEGAGFAKIQAIHRSNQWIELADAANSGDYKQIWLDPYRHREAIQLEYRSDAVFKRKGLVATYLTSNNEAHKDFWIHALSKNTKAPLFGANPKMAFSQGNTVISSVFHSDDGASLKVKLKGYSEDKGSFGYNTNPYKTPCYFSNAGETIVMQLNDTAGKANFADGVDVYLSGHRQEDVVINLAGDNPTNVIAHEVVRYNTKGWYRVMFKDKVAIDVYNHLFISITSDSTQIAYQKLTQRDQHQQPIFFSEDTRQPRIYNKAYSMRLLVSGNVAQEATFGTTAPSNYGRSSSGGAWSLVSLCLMLLLGVVPRLNRRV